MYNNIIKYIITSNNIRNQIDQLDLSDYEDNKHYFDIQKMINNTGDVEIKHKIFKSYISDSKIGVKNYDTINNTDTSNFNLYELLYFITDIPHYSLKLSDGILDIEVYKSKYISTSILIISFGSVEIYISDGKREEYILNEHNPIFKFIDDIDAECSRRLININEIGMDIHKLISELKEEQITINKRKKDKDLKSRIFNYLH